VLQVLWTELAGPPAVFLRQHFVFHGLSTSSKHPANCDFYPYSHSIEPGAYVGRPARPRGLGSHDCLSLRVGVRLGPVGGRASGRGHPGGI
jgi:hypothetical protein